MSIVRGAVSGPKAVLPLRRSTHGVSRSFLVQADDGADYWCKAINNPTSPRIPVNEQIVARLGRLVGIAVTEPHLIDVSGIRDWEFVPGVPLGPGWVHAARAVEPPAFEVRTLQHRGEDNNRVRHAGFYALTDWLAGGDEQWLYSGAIENAYFSHDHGHFFPGGPDWSVGALNAEGTAARFLGIDPAGLDSSEVHRLADAIEAVTPADIDAVMSCLPREWPVDDAELAVLSDFIAQRRGPAASRLRTLVA